MCSDRKKFTLPEKLKELKDQNAPQEDIEYVEKELEKYRNLKTAVRDIGDGIAAALCFEFDFNVVETAQAFPELHCV